ncbi:MAG: M23 family metallopeptidase, partial [Nitrospirae bacterium]
GSGRVVEARRKGAAGRMVKIRHNDRYTTAYLHLSRFARGIRRGVRVKQGQVIGYVGATGLATGPHLDYRFYVNGRPVDPLGVKSPPARPVKEEYRQAFRKLAGEYLARLAEPPSATAVAGGP